MKHICRSEIRNYPIILCSICPEIIIYPDPTYCESLNIWIAGEDNLESLELLEKEKYTFIIWE